MFQGTTDIASNKANVLIKVKDHRQFQVNGSAMSEAEPALFLTLSANCVLYTEHRIENAEYK